MTSLRRYWLSTFTKNTNTEVNYGRKSNSQRGSLALEHVLFIGAVVAMSVGLGTFYRNIGNYLQNVSFAVSPTNIGGATEGDSH